MSTPYASTNTFSIADDKFYAYLAQDSHGSRCEVYMVNGQVVSHMAFHKACIAALGDGAIRSSLACSAWNSASRPQRSWSQSAEPISLSTGRPTEWPWESSARPGVRCRLTATKLDSKTSPGPWWMGVVRPPESSEVPCAAWTTNVWIEQP